MDYTLVTAAAQAAGPCPPGQEAQWTRRVQDLAIDLHLAAVQTAQNIAQLDQAKKFAAYLERVEIEEASRRGLLTLRLPDGSTEPIRTEQQETHRGQAMIERARELVGHWVLVYRYNEGKAAERFHNVRMVAHLMDLGDGAIKTTIAKEIVLRDADGDTQRARAAWNAAGMPDQGTIAIQQLDKVRAQLIAPQAPTGAHTP